MKNPSLNFNEQTLAELSVKYGVVSNVKIIYDGNTGKAKGLAFVVFPTRDEAQAAIDDASNLMVDGKLLTRKFIDKKSENKDALRDNGYEAPRGNSYGATRGNNSLGGEKHNVFVGNLGFKTSENLVKKFFADCGDVIDVIIPKNEDRRSRGFCIVMLKLQKPLKKQKLSPDKS